MLCSGGQRRNSHRNGLGRDHLYYRTRSGSINLFRNGSPMERGSTTSRQNVDVLGMQPGQAQLLTAHTDAVQIKSGASVAADGIFTVQLSSTPRAGQTLLLEERLTDASQNMVASLFSIPIPVGVETRREPPHQKIAERVLFAIESG